MHTSNSPHPLKTSLRVHGLCSTRKPWGIFSTIFALSALGASLTACEDQQEDSPGESLEGIADFSDTTSYISSVSDVAWEWEAEHSFIWRELLPTAYGLVAASRSGTITGLHGESGTELWNYEATSHDFSVAVTTDGLETVIVDPPSEEGDGELVLLDAATGEEISQSPLPEDAISHPDLVTDDHLLIPSDGELTAHDLTTAEPSWTYTPEPHCLGVPDFSPEEDWRWPVSSIEGSVLLPAQCSAEGSEEPEPQEQNASMHTLALDNRDGTELWSAEPLPTTLGDNPLEHLHYYALTPSNDGEYLIQRLSQEFRVLEASTGEEIEVEWPEEGQAGISLTNRVSTTGDHAVWYEEQESEDQEHRYTKYSHSGDVLDEILIRPNQHEVVDNSTWSPLGRVADLDDGLLTYTCGNQCPNFGNMESPLSATFTPWRGGDPVTIELDQLDGREGHEDKRTRFLPVPGAVISHQADVNGTASGSLVALN
ncbi:outer membrane protein assembly factor BamB family protein [Nocardiopsis nanhaiensis]